MNYLQETLLKEMNIFHNICRENNLTYFLVGGSMLGAFRHKGFIPWDDDIDVAMPRNDYNKLIKHYNEWVDSSHKIKCQDSEPGCPIAFARFEDVDYFYQEEMRDTRGYSSGISIDIFPIDGMPDGIIQRWFLVFIIRILKIIFYGLITNDKEGRSSIKKIVIIIFKKIFKRENIVKKMNSILKRISIDENRKIGNLLGSNTISELYNEIMPYDVYFPAKKYEFEGFYFYGVNKPEIYLEHLFGKDYMKLPKISDRIGKHNVNFKKI